jgi:hypothetical protein
LAYDASSAVRLAAGAGAAFPAGGSIPHHLRDGNRYADYPGGLRFVIPPKGQRYIETTSRTAIYAGYSGKTLDSYYLSKSDCLARDVTCSASASSVIESSGDPDLLDVQGTAGPGMLMDEPLDMGEWLDPPQFSIIDGNVERSTAAALFITVPTSLAGGLLLWLGFPADITQSISPASSMRADRNAAIMRGVTFLMVILLALLITGATVGYIASDTSNPVLRYIVVLAALGPLAVTLSAWGRLQVVRAALAVSGRLPWHLMRFLEDAHARGVLRQAGAAYQFRHVRLQEHLVSRPKTHADVSPGSQ